MYVTQLCLCENRVTLTLTICDRLIWFHCSTVRQPDCLDAVFSVSLTPVTWYSVLPLDPWPWNPYWFLERCKIDTVMYNILSLYAFFPGDKKVMLILFLLHLEICWLSLDTFQIKGFRAPHTCNKLRLCITNQRFTLAYCPLCLTILLYKEIWDELHCLCHLQLNSTHNPVSPIWTKTVIQSVPVNFNKIVC